MTDTSEQLSGVGLSLSLTVKDLEVSKRWYVDAFGFTSANGMERDGVLRSIMLTAGVVRVILNVDDGAKGWGRNKGVGLALNFVTDKDVDTIASRLKTHGISLVSEPADKPWGARMFQVTDPDGFLWTVSRFNKS